MSEENLEITLKEKKEFNEKEEELEEIYKGKIIKGFLFDKEGNLFQTIKLDCIPLTVGLPYWGFTKESPGLSYRKFGIVGKRELSSNSNITICFFEEIDIGEVALIKGIKEENIICDERAIKISL